MEAEGLDGVKQIAGCLEAELLEAVVDELAHLLLADGDAEAVVDNFGDIAVFVDSLFMTLVEITEFSRDRIVENQAARGRNDKIRIIIVESVRKSWIRISCSA